MKGCDRRSGYLLLEVLLALAVLSIVVVMIFQIVQTTLRVTADIHYLQNQQRKVDGLYELLRRNFGSMPRSCTFQTRKDHGSTELIFRYAPFHFSWINSGAVLGTVLIGSRLQPDGRSALSVLQQRENSSPSDLSGANEPKAAWFPLLGDLDRISWQFFDLPTAKWSSDWPDLGKKPYLVELTFQFAGHNRLERCVFRWPIAQTGI